MVSTDVATVSADLKGANVSLLLAMEWQWHRLSPVSELTRRLRSMENKSVLQFTL